MPLNTAGLTALMDAGAAAPLYLAIGSGPLAANQNSTARVAVTWDPAAGGALIASGVPYNFVGPNNGDASHMLFFSAPTAGTFYGEQELTGDQVYNPGGAFQVASLALTAVSDDAGPSAPLAPFAAGSVVGVPTGTTLTNRSSLGAPTSTETFTITHPLTGDSAELDVSVYRGLRFTTTITPAAGAGNTILFEHCEFTGPGNWNVEVDNTGGSTDIMQPLVVFNRCTFDGGDVTDKNLIGGYCWVLECDMLGAEDGWAGWYYNVGYRSNFIPSPATTIDQHCDGVQCLDTGRSTWWQCWFSAGEGLGASQAFRVGTEAGAAQDIGVYYSTLDRGGYSMQFRGDSGAGDITNVTVQGCRWTDTNAFGAVDVEQTTGMTWVDNQYFNGEIIPSPV